MNSARALGPAPRRVDAIRDLEAQLQALAPMQPARLVVRCAETLSIEPPRWQSLVPDSLFLRSDGADVDAPEIRETLRHAVLVWGLEELVVVAHTRCHRLDPDPGTDRAAPETPGPGLPDHLQRRIAHTQRQVEAARQQVRRAVGSLVRDPDLAKAACFGLVHLVESGVVVAYDPERDDFEALL